MHPPRRVADDGLPPPRRPPIGTSGWTGRSARKSSPSARSSGPSRSPSRSAASVSRIALSWNVLVQGLVRRIPRGRVATYGQLAALLGAPRAAREVGWALSACVDRSVPCHRVVDREGRTAPNFHSQRARLEDEGVAFVDGRVDLERHRWRPRGPHQIAGRRSTGRSMAAPSQPKAAKNSGRFESGPRTRNSGGACGSV